MSDNPTQPRGTTAHTPDLNWSQVRETVLMIELAAVQIETAMKDSNSSVDVLTDSFTTMAGYMRMISETIQTLPDNDETAQVKQNLIGASGHVSGMVHQAIIAFQFYDKLVQRLGHVGLGLAELGTLIGDQRRLFSPQEWVALQQRIKEKYSTPEEIAMFEAVMRGQPVHEAVSHFLATRKDRQDDIELF